MYKNHISEPVQICELAFRNVRSGSSQESHPPRLQNVLNIWRGRHCGETQDIHARSGPARLQSLYKSSGPSGARNYLGVVTERRCTVARGQRIIKNEECKLRHPWGSIPTTPPTRYTTLGKIVYCSPPRFLNNKRSFEDRQRLYVISRKSLVHRTQGTHGYH